MKNFDNRPIFGRNLVRLRKERKLTQGELAEMTGMSTRMIAYYEIEAVKPPIDKIESLSKALKVSINELLGTNEPNAVQNELIHIDGRTLKRIKKILELSPEERHLVYSYVDSLHFKKEKKSKVS